jgi:glucosamine--fructose-6-phosphate aminotransferase (isomerizing)
MLAAALAIESRGGDATGYGWADELGHPWYWKAPGRASRVAHDAPLPKGLRTAIGHTRYATMGDPKVNENNHPVIAPGLVLVHNGRVDNHAELFRELGVKPEAGVDSEALAALLAYGPGALNASHPTDLLRKVRGVAAIAWLDADDPHVLHLARLSGRPMTLAWTKRGDLVMSSTRETMRTLERLGKVSLHDLVDVPEGRYMRVEHGHVTERAPFPVVRPKAKAPADVPHPAATKRIKNRPSPTRGEGEMPSWLTGSNTGDIWRTREHRRDQRRVVRPAGHDGLVESLADWRDRK